MRRARGAVEMFWYNGSVQKYFSAPLLLLTQFSLKEDFLNGGSGQATKIGDSNSSISSRVC